MLVQSKCLAQVCRTLIGLSCREAKILVGACQQAQGLTVGMAVVPQLLQQEIGTLHVAAAGQGQTL